MVKKVIEGIKESRQVKREKTKVTVVKPQSDTHEWHQKKRQLEQIRYKELEDENSTDDLD